MRGGIRPIKGLALGLSQRGRIAQIDRGLMRSNFHPKVPNPLFFTANAVSHSRKAFHEPDGAKFPRVPQLVEKNRDVCD
jgi:hypothetical protein